MIEELIKNCAVESEKEFTRTLKGLEKSLSTYPDFKTKDAVKIYNSCVKILGSTDANQRYNALRLLKYLTTSEEFLLNYYEKLFDIYINALNNPNGKIRIAGNQLLSRWTFGMLLITETFTPKSHKERFDRKTARKREEFYIDAYLRLLRTERAFIKENKIKLKKSDLPGRKFVPWASETKNPFLKSLRMGQENFHPEGKFLKKLLNQQGYMDKSPKSHVLPQIKFKYMKTPDRENLKPYPDMLCNKCKNQIKIIGAVRNAHTDNPIAICEDCTIEDFQKDYGFTTREAAAARRRRLFDIPYLFTELFLEEFMRRNNVKDINNLEEKDYAFITEISCAIFNENFDKWEKTELEETEEQVQIECVLLPIVVDFFEKAEVEKILRF